MSLARVDVPSAYLEHGQLASVLAYLWALRRSAQQAASLWLALRHINRVVLHARFAAIQYSSCRVSIFESAVILCIQGHSSFDNETSPRQSL